MVHPVAARFPSRCATAPLPAFACGAGGPLPRAALYLPAMCNRYRLSPGDYAKLEAQGVVLPFPPDESWPVPKNPFEYDVRPTDPAVVLLASAEALKPA